MCVCNLMPFFIWRDFQKRLRLHYNCYSKKSVEWRGGRRRRIFYINSIQSRMKHRKWKQAISEESWEKKILATFLSRSNSQLAVWEKDVCSKALISFLHSFRSRGNLKKYTYKCAHIYNDSCVIVIIITLLALPIIYSGERKTKKWFPLYFHCYLKSTFYTFYTYIFCINTCITTHGQSELNFSSINFV